MQHELYLSLRLKPRESNPDLDVEEFSVFGSDPNWFFKVALHHNLDFIIVCQTCSKFARYRNEIDQFFQVGQAITGKDQLMANGLQLQQKLTVIPKYIRTFK